MTNQEKWQEFKELLKEIETYGRCEGRAYFDMECIAPEEGIEKCGEDVALLSLQIFRLSHAPRYIELLTELHADSEGLSNLQKKTIEHLYEDYARTKNIPEDFAHKMDLDSTKAYADWLAAKKESDFSKFRDSFAAVIDDSRKAVQLRDTKKETVYDTLLDDFEKGGSIAQLDEFFAKLKARIVPLLMKILADGKPVREDFLSRPVPVRQQEACSRYLMEVEGLRKTATVLATTEHPFTTHFGPTDVRVTTHYYEERFISNIFSTMHEGGHALFMQNEPQEYFDEFTADRMSCAMHECISRFYENIVGRSEAFIHYIMPRIRELSGSTFDDVTEREFYEAVNIAKPDLIRCDADELTYCLHILVRYELEKAFVNGEITVDEIPALWNAKYKEYLGIDVPDDARGCLQDVHWTGSYGYFPSYALGSAYGAQILRTMQKDFDFYGAIREGDLGRILDWFKEHVFGISSLLDPDEWIRTITGESLNADYFLDYLEEKFTALYEL